MKDLFGRTLTRSLAVYPVVDAAGEEPLAEDLYEWDAADLWEVTEATPMVEQPPGFRIPLMAYQLASIHVLHEMEKYKCFTTATRDIFSSAFVLSNDMGSGKSATVLGLIAHSPVPSSGPHYPITIDNYSNTSTRSHGAPRSVVTRRYSRVLKPAIIFVGYGVLSQWSAEVAKFMTGKTTFVIDGIHALRRFYELVYTKDINKYDMILVKNKDVTGVWKWTHDEIEEAIVDRGSRKIYNMIAVICRNMCFTRLVVDDFDTIGVPQIAGNINALSTILISSTQATISNRTWTNTEHATSESLIHHNNIAFSSIGKNSTIFGLFNVHVQPEYIKKYMSVGRPRYFYYKFLNNSGKIMDLINCMAGDKVSAIMEALNGDAVGEAAKIAGIEAVDTNQIFKALLQKNYTNLADARAVLLHFDEYFSQLDIDSLAPFSECPDQTDTYTRRDVRARRPVEWRYPGIRSLLKDEEEKWQAQFDECAMCLSKFKASVKANECTVCCLELDDPDENYAIMPCCNEIIHADCAVRGCNFQKEHCDGGSVIVGRCPFDKAHRVLWTAVTYIRGGFDLSQIDESKILDCDAPPREAPVAPRIKKKTAPRTKYDALQDIIRGVRPEEQTELSLLIPSVMQGRTRLPNPEYVDLAPRVRADMERAGISDAISNELMRRLFPEWRPRVLIFSSFDESLTRIEKDLEATGTAYARLGGTMQQMNDQIESFNTRRCDVLLIKSTTHCSSLNLQMATDLVFAHQINDSHIMRQVLGRIQRAGRKTDARIHWLLFENEVSSLDRYIHADA